LERVLDENGSIRPISPDGFDTRRIPHLHLTEIRLGRGADIFALIHQSRTIGQPRWLTE
jgi:hypothetical protein